MSRKIQFLQKFLISIWISAGLTCSMSMEKYYISPKTYADCTPMINALRRLCRNLSSDRLLTFCVFLFGWLLITFVWKQKYSRKEKIFSFLFSNVFTALQLLGHSYAENNSWDALFRNNFIRVRAFLIYVGIFLAVYYLFLASFALLDAVAMRERAEGRTAKQRFWLSVAVILLCWLPYYILFWPGTSSADTSYQILQFFGYKTFILKFTSWQGGGFKITNHNPFLTTLLFGGFTKLGLMLGKAEYGIGLYTALQALVTAIALEGSLFYLKRFGISDKFLKAGTIFIALFPLFPIYTLNVLKDSFFSVFCLTTTLLLVEAIRTEGEAFQKKRFIAALLGSSLLVILSKSQGLYIMLVTAVCFLILYRRYWLSVLVSLVIPVVFVQFVWLQVLLPMWNIAPAGKQEVLGILFQQTARYVTEYPEDVTEEEESAIRGVLDYDSLAEKFSPILYDPVKWTYNQQATDEELSAYYHTWFQQFLRHPDSYIQATLNTCTGSFYLDSTSSMAYFSFRNRAKEGHELYIDNTFSPDFMEKVVHPIRLFLQRIPVVSLFFSVGIYPWMILFFLCFLLCANACRYFPASLIYFLSVGILIICPASANFRYSMPFVYVLPFLSGAILLLARNRQPNAQVCPEPNQEAGQK